MAGDALTVEFRPRLWEAFWATLVLFAGLSALAVGTGFVFTSPLQQITCDRVKCQLHEDTLFGGSVDFTLDVAQLRDSRVELSHPRGRERTAWVVQSHGSRFEIGNPTDDAELAATFDRLARDFGAFLADPARPTFAASFRAVGSQPVWLFFAMGGLLAAWAIKWRRGWKARLVFDRAAGTLVIRQRPWARTRTLRLSDVSDVRASDRVAHTVYGNFRWETIELLGRNGKALWRYRTMFTRKTFEHVQSSIKQIDQFLR